MLLLGTLGSGQALSSLGRCLQMEYCFTIFQRTCLHSALCEPSAKSFGILRSARKTVELRQELLYFEGLFIAKISWKRLYLQLAYMFSSSSSSLATYLSFIVQCQCKLAGVLPLSVLGNIDEFLWRHNVCDWYQQLSFHVLSFLIYSGLRKVLRLLLVLVEYI